MNTQEMIKEGFRVSAEVVGLSRERLMEMIQKVNDKMARFHHEKLKKGLAGGVGDTNTMYAMIDSLEAKVERYEKSFQEIKEYTKNRMPSEQEYRDGTGKVDGINHKGDIEELYSIAKDALDEDKE